MEMILIATVMFLLIAVGSLFLIPRSTTKGKSTKAANPDVTAKTSRSYSRKDVSLHNTRTDCWIIIKDKVYDVTSYVEEHPGGDAILNNAGSDSTEGFYGPQHATRVFDMIDDFYVGDLRT